MDRSELVEITFRLPLTALGRLSSLLETVGQTASGTERGETAGFDPARFEAVRAAETGGGVLQEPALPERAGRSAEEIRREERSSPAPSDPAAEEVRIETAEEAPRDPRERRTREERTVALGEVRRPQRDVSLGEGRQDRERPVRLGEVRREERAVSLERPVRSGGETRVTGTDTGTERDLTLQSLSARWERDARRYDGGFSLK